MVGLWLFATMAMAKPAPPVDPVPVHVRQARDEIDWKVEGDATVALLGDYLRVDTVSPPGNEDRAVQFIGDYLIERGIPYITLPHRPGRSSLVARLEAENPEGTLCLMSHTDVVTSERDKWEVDPLGGEIRDGQLWGRGALDMKGMGALELKVFELIARQELPLRMNVVLLAVADEENTNFGAQEVIDRFWDQTGCTHMINEGGLGIRDALFEGQTLHAISVAEKGILWTDLVTEGPAGHGSTIDEGEAPERLLEAMNAVTKYKAKPVIDEALYVMLANVGEHKGGLTGSILKSRMLVNLVVKGKLMANSATRAALTDTVHLTGMRGAEATNVVPSEVRAQYDCRLLPGTEPEEHLARLEKLTRKVEGVHWEVHQAELANGSPWTDPFYEAIALYAVEDRPDSVAGPVLSVGFTDSLYFRPHGVKAYGYVPFIVTQEEAETMHGHNERVSLENIHEGVRRLYSMVVHVAAQP